MAQLKEYESPQSRLIRAIYHHFGGPAATVKVLKNKGIELPRQALMNWMVRGHIPLEQLLIISEALKVSPYCLNYEGYSKLVRKNKSWESVVRGCSILSAATKKEVIEWTQENA